MTTLTDVSALFSPEAGVPTASYSEYLYQNTQRWIRLPNPANQEHAKALIEFRDLLLRLVMHLPELAALEAYKTVTSRGIADGINFLVLCLYSDLTNRKDIRNPASADGFVHFVYHNHTLTQAVEQFLELRHTPFYGGIPGDAQQVLANLEVLCQEVYGDTIWNVFACPDPVCRWDQ